MLLSDWQIALLAQEQGMIDPFVPKQVRDGGISYGLSTAGYDMRLAPEIRRISEGMGLLDPKRPEMVNWEAFTCPFPYFFTIPPHGFVLARSVERFNLPRNVAGVCMGKSTYARLGLVCNTTPLEPGWCGWLTLELSNTTDLPIRVYVNEGIAQVMFHEIADPHTSYADRKGKYQDQPAEPTLAKL
jgi:dCTP deaminase